MRSMNYELKALKIYINEKWKKNIGARRKEDVEGRRLDLLNINMKMKIASALCYFFGWEEVEKSDAQEIQLTVGVWWMLIN